MPRVSRLIRVYLLLRVIGERWVLLDAEPASPAKRPVIDSIMSIRRFFHGDLANDPKRIDLPREEAKHAKRVLRLEQGDAVELFDGAGRVASGVVAAVGQGVSIEVGSVRDAERSHPVINVAVALPKGDRAATLIEKLSELGADRVVPLITQRSVVDPGKGKLERFDRIALESAKQCGRAWMMTIDKPTMLEHVLERPGDALRLIGDPDGAGVQDLPSVAGAGESDAASSVVVLIGPEGGWTLAERDEAAEAGFLPWCFSRNVLRVETAAIAAVAILRDRFRGEVE